MGAWGAGPFENDDAIDWVAELAGSRDASPVLTALQRVVDAKETDYLQAPEASIAVAAAEAVSAALGAPPANLPPELGAWIDKHRDAIVPDMVKKGYEATVRVATKSELRELWDESDWADEWHAAMTDLQRRLSGATAGPEDELKPV
jgi:hypothetical protein